MNYNDQMENLISTFKGRPTILLHSCCAPCSTAVLDRLKEHFKITVFYYNPNIYPKQEYEKRKAEQIKYINLINDGDNKIEFLDCDHDAQNFYTAVVGQENELEGGNRCKTCFALRLNKTYEVSKKQNFDYFGTTLTVSPHKNASIINEIGKSISNNFLVADFKKKEGYKKSIELSTKNNIYRQDYCGCEFSKGVE